MSVYLEEFKSDSDIIEKFEAPPDALNGANVLIGWYGYGSYCGNALVVFQRDGKLWEVNGNHCSCSGLEGQWEPEETTPEALLKRDAIDREYDGYQEANRVLREVAHGLINGGSNHAY